MTTRALPATPGQWAYHYDLLHELVVRDLKLRYKRSFLGLAWSLANPLAQLLVFSFVFTRVLPLNRPNFTPFLFCGLLAWNWFSSSLFGGTGSITNNRDLVRRPGFPAPILPAVQVATDLLHFLLALPILFLFLLVSGLHPGVAVVFVPLVMLVQFLFTLSLVYIVATVHVTFRDTQYLLGVFLLLMFYLTPIFYDVTNVPANFQAVYRLNPMLHVIESYRAIFLNGATPELRALTVLLVVSLLLLWIGYSFFQRASWRFVEEI
jgi:lipopolysaccharide transport system permease protein